MNVSDLDRSNSPFEHPKMEPVGGQLSASVTLVLAIATCVILLAVVTLCAWVVMT